MTSDSEQASPLFKEAALRVAPVDESTFYSIAEIEAILTEDPGQTQSNASPSNTHSDATRAEQQADESQLEGELEEELIEDEFDENLFLEFTHQKKGSWLARIFSKVPRTLDELLWILIATPVRVLLWIIILAPWRLMRSLWNRYQLSVLGFLRRAFILQASTEFDLSEYSNDFRVVSLCSSDIEGSYGILLMDREAYWYARSLQRNPDRKDIKIKCSLKVLEIRQGQLVKEFTLPEVFPSLQTLLEIKPDGIRLIVPQVSSYDYWSDSPFMIYDIDRNDTITFTRTKRNSVQKDRFWLYNTAASLCLRQREFSLEDLEEETDDYDLDLDMHPRADEFGFWHNYMSLPDKRELLAIDGDHVYIQFFKDIKHAFTLKFRRTVKNRLVFERYVDFKSLNGEDIYPELNVSNQAYFLCIYQGRAYSFNMQDN